MDAQIEQPFVKHITREEWARLRKCKLSNQELRYKPRSQVVTNHKLKRNFFNFATHNYRENTDRASYVGWCFLYVNLDKHTQTCNYRGWIVPKIGKVVV